MASLTGLPVDVLREIILHTIHDPIDPQKFNKYCLLPLASTCRRLREVSIEFLFWSVDVFEASFGLQHRVLKSAVAFERFNEVLDTQTGYIRSGVRRLLVRDRDKTASGHLWTILAKLENLRSLHLDGPFHRPGTTISFPFPPAPEELFEREDVMERLVNVTLLGVLFGSPIYPFLLRRGSFTNLTRIDYVEDIIDPSSSSPPHPFSSFASDTEPVFPYLRTFILTFASQSPESIDHTLHFLALHHKTLERLGVRERAGGEFYRPQWPPPDEQGLPKPWIPCYHRLWNWLGRLSSLKLLALSATVIQPDCVPTSRIILPNLRALHLHGHFYRGFMATGRITQYDIKELNQMAPLLKMLPSPHIACGDYYDGQRSWKSPMIYQYSHWVYEGDHDHESALIRMWLESSQFAGMKTFTRLGGRLMASFSFPWSEKGLVVSYIQTEDERRRLLDTVGHWSLAEDADLETPFVSV